MGRLDKFVSTIFVGIMFGFGILGVVVRAPILVLGSTVLFIAYVFDRRRA